MLKILTILSSICLVVYCVVGLFFPSTVFSGNPTVDVSGYDTLLIEIESADKETLKNLSKMLINDKKTDLINGDPYLNAAIDTYFSFFQILVGLLFVHFSILIQYIKVISKHNKPIKLD